MWRERAASASDARDYTAQGRVSLWKSGWELFRERPITGFGLADHGARIAAHRRADATFVAGHFHSNPVQVLVSTGVVGGVAYAGFHATLLWLLWRRRGALAAAALGVWAAFHIAGFFDWSFGDAEVTYHFFFWMGLGLAGAACDVDPPEPDR
jgi:O-antigen ligase